MCFDQKSSFSLVKKGICEWLKLCMRACSRESPAQPKLNMIFFTG